MDQMPRPEPTFTAHVPDTVPINPSPSAKVGAWLYLTAGLAARWLVVAVLVWAVWTGLWLMVEGLANKVADRVVERIK